MIGVTSADPLVLASNVSIQAAYVAVFALGAVGCGLAAIRARRLDHRDTRVGLISLLALCGLWAGGTSVRLLVADPAISRLLHLFELIVGFATVGAWLYFAAAYSGETYHRQPAYRRGALAGYLAVVAVKLTNPVHGLYVSTRFDPTPFPHLVIDAFRLHLAVMTLSYALAALGFYMLFRLFVDSKAPTGSLIGLVGLAGLPVVINTVGYLDVPGVLQLSYEPLGVAAFGIGTLYFAETTFQKARWSRHQRLLDELDEAVLVLDNEGCVRDFNEAAAGLFPDLATGVGEPVGDVVPSVVAALEGTETDADADADPETIEITRDGTSRYYLPSVAELTHGSYTMGRVIVCADVTRVERQRRELHRQNDQLDGFAAAVAHELRNTLAIIHGNVRVVAEAAAGEQDDTLAGALETSLETLDRMETIVDDLTALARYAQTVDSTATIDFSDLSEVVLPDVSDEVTTTLTGVGQLEADPKRLEELLRQAARLAGATGGTTLEVTLENDRLVLTTDGEPVPEGNERDLFTYGTAVPHARAGMLGPNIQALARAHGWSVSLDEAYREGIRIHVTGVQVHTETT